MNEKQGGVVVVVAVGVCYLWVSVWGGGVCLQGQVHQAREQVKLPLCLGSGSLAGRRVKGARDKGGTECVQRGRCALGWTKSSNHHCPSTASGLPFRAENSLACISSARGRCGLRGEGGRGGVLPWVTARLRGATLTFLPRGQPTVSRSAGSEAIRARLAPGGCTFGAAGEGMEARPQAGPCPGDRDWGPTPSWPPVALSAGATQPHLAFIIHF